MAIVLALCSALTYGLSDFVGGFVSRRSSAWSVAVLGQSSSAVCTAVAALLVTGSPSPGDFVWAMIGGVGGGMGVGFLYRGFTSGRMSVVAPVSAVGAALVPVTAGAIGGERPGALVWVGIVVAMPAIWLVSSIPSAAKARSGFFGEGLLDGVLAGLGFGLLFACVGQIPDSAGLWPLTLTQVVSVPAVVLLAGLVRAPWVPRCRAVRWAVLTGPLGAVATLTFLLAAQQGYLTVSGVLAALYPASTVVLAMFVLREHIHRAQALGLLLCAVTVALVAAG
ncbi:MAG: DMT family transporter [Marmoricola sp.]